MTKLITNDDIINLIKVEFLSLIKLNQNGYFISLEKTYNWLENNNVYNDYAISESSRRNFKKRYLRNDKFLLDEAESETDFYKDYVMIKNKNNIAFPWFSIEGFKTFCMVANEPKSVFVRKYFIQVEKDYMRVLEQSAIETKLELLNVNSKLSKSSFSLNIISNRCQQYLEEKLETDFKLKKVENLERILDDEKDFSSEGNLEYKCYNYLQMMYMKKIPLYIVCPEYVIGKVDSDLDKSVNSNLVEDITPIEIYTIPKKSILKKIKKVKPKEFRISSDSDSDAKPVVKVQLKKNKAFNSNNLYYRKEYNKYSFKNDIEQDDFSGETSPTLYYYIPGFAEKSTKNPEIYFKICDLFVKDKEHLISIKEQLDTMDIIDDKYIYKTPKKWIYKVSYTDIKNISLSVIQSRLFNLLSESTIKL